jgi:hypothetical protein
MSMTASGTVGKVATFSNWKGRPYVRSRVIPKNPKSAKQRGVRAMLKYLSKHWTAATTENKATWLTLAAASQISAFNAYVRANMNTWQQDEAPADMPTPSRTGTLTAPSALAANETAPHTVLVEATLTAAQDKQAVIIYRCPAAAPDYTWNSVIAVIDPTTDTTLSYVDINVPTGAYKYLVAVTNTNGKMTPAAAPVDGTVS